MTGPDKAREALAHSAADLAAATALAPTDALDLLARAAGWRPVGDGQVVVDRADLGCAIRDLTDAGKEGHALYRLRAAHRAALDAGRVMPDGRTVWPNGSTAEPGWQQTAPDYDPAWAAHRAALDAGSTT